MSMLKYVITPWFSREDWNEVYDNIFGNSVNGWKEAYNTITVWKSRIAKLPVGIEGTIPLLHAQIALNESCLEISYRNSILNMAILRFVSIVTKGYEEQYTVGKAMCNVATHMNLPIYLVDLRNQIIHTDGVFGTSYTLQAALRISLHWIKVHYWDEEKNKYDEESVENDEEHNSTDDNDSDLISDYDECEQLFSTINIFDNLINSIMYEQKTSSHKADFRKIISHLCESFKNYYKQNQESAMKSLVKNLFLSETMKTLFDDQNNGHKKKKCKNCSCRIATWLISGLSHLIRMIVQLKALNDYVEQLAKHGKDRVGLCLQWFSILTNGLMDGEKIRCRVHRFNFKNMLKNFDFQWKQLVYHLFTLGHSSSNALAIELSKILNFESNIIKALQELSNLYSTSVEKPCKGRDENSANVVNDQIDETEIKTSRHVLMETQKVSNELHRHAENICSTVKMKDLYKTGVRRNSTGVTALGFLPHQENDSTFYHHLRLSL